MAMKSNTYLGARSDRLSTWEELSEVITLLSNLHQLQLPLETALDFVENADAASNADDRGLWIDASSEDNTGGGIESLANIIVGRRDRPN